MKRYIKSDTIARSLYSKRVLPGKSITASEIESPNYVIHLDKFPDGTYNLFCNEVLRPDGTKKLLHNETDVTFQLRAGGAWFYILSGWHIGTEDFELDEGDSWDDYVEYYHPGITRQVMDMIQSGNFTRR